MSAVIEYPQRHPISAEEFLRMGEAGVFAPEARLELIEGEIIEMAPIGPPHAGTVAILNRLLVEGARGRAVVWGQSPVILARTSVPQPDLALLKPRRDSYTRSHPAPADVLLVVEVSDTTFAFDTGRKIPLYARAGIVEAWIVDVAQKALRVFRDPCATGYRTTFTVTPDATASVQAMPEIGIAVASLFPA